MQIVSFSNVTRRHLKVLGLDVILNLDLDPKLVEAANGSDSLPNQIVHKDLLGYFQKHFNVSASHNVVLPLSIGLF